MTASTGLVLTDLELKRGEAFSLHVPALTIARGEALAIVGPNGAGKSTLLRGLAGLLPRVNGVLRFDRFDLAADRADYLACLHYAGHKEGVKGAFTIAQTMAFWVALFGGEPERVGLALDAFGLAELSDVPAAFLSAGQRRRLGLARLLVAPRPLWLLDEPASGLDSASRTAFGAVLSRHRDAGGVVVFASHGELDLPGARVLHLGHTS